MGECRKASPRLRGNSSGEEVKGLQDLVGAGKEGKVSSVLRVVGWLLRAPSAFRLYLWSTGLLGPEQAIMFQKCEHHVSKRLKT